ncbi:MAG TPA: hypothetical protein VL651_08020 [Bacteroidia bacterium]|nr:hypothetical protein [Bacteroidia bacterium]
MKINRDNCEAWFLDYYEGVLDYARTEEMFSFLTLNPDLQEIFDSYENLSFDAESEIKFEGKNSLKREIPEVNGVSESNYNAWIVALLEGNLDAKEEKMVKEFMAAHPKVQREYELLKKTILKPDTSSTLGVSVKSSLKKSTPITAENFMEFAVQAMDGELDDVMMISFFDYIAQHEEYKKQYDELLSTKLTADASVVFENRNSLKKNPVIITTENFSEYAVLAMDDELDKVTAISFFDFIGQHKNFAKEFEQLKATRLVADTNVVFPDKESLKKKDRGGIIWWRAISFSAAAVLVIMLGIYFFNRTDVVNPGTDHVIANNNHDQHSNGNNIVPKTNDMHDSVLNPVQHTSLTNDQQLANVTKNDHHHHYTNNTNNHEADHADHFMTGTTNQTAFVSIPVKNSITPLQTHYYTNVDFSDANYSDVNTQTVAQNTNETPSFGQFAMRWMKNKLDMRGDKNTNDDQDGDMVAMNDQSNTDVTGFDLTAAALDRLSYATGRDMHLEKNSDGTVLSAFGYDVVLARN